MGTPATATSSRGLGDSVPGLRPKMGLALGLATQLALWLATQLVLRLAPQLSKDL